MASLPGHLRVLNPHPAVFAFYDGRVEGYRMFAEKNWIDEGERRVWFLFETLRKG